MKPIKLVVLIGLVAAGARADSIVAAFDQQTLTGYAGSPVIQVVTGTLQNVTSNPIDITLFSIDVDVAGPGFVVDTSVFDPPEESLAPNQTSADFEMFTIDFASATIGVYDWDYQVLDDNDNVAASGEIQVDVDAEPTPEPGSLGLMFTALGLAAAYQQRQRFSSARPLSYLKLTKYRHQHLSHFVTFHPFWARQRPGPFESPAPDPYK
jgi:hypothetical protein